MKTIRYAGLLLVLLTPAACMLPKRFPVTALVAPTPAVPALSERAAPRYSAAQLVAVSCGWLVDDDTFQELLAWLKDGGVFTCPMPGTLPTPAPLPAAPTTSSWLASASSQPE